MKPVGFEAAETHFRPSLGRGALALAIVLYGFARFGLAAGGRIAVAAAIFGLLEAAQMSVRSRWLKALLIASQFALIVAVALAPAPLGFGSTIPGPMMLQTPLLLLMFCLLASYASSIDAILMAVAGIALVLCWFAGVAFVQADPRTLTRASLHMKDYHTPLELMRAVNQPHYLQTDPRKEELRAGVVIGAILCFGALRVSRLARQSATRGGAPRPDDVLLAATYRHADNRRHWTAAGAAPRRCARRRSRSFQQSRRTPCAGDGGGGSGALS